MRKLIFLLLFIPFGLFAQQIGDNTILIHTPFSAQENFIKFKKHLDVCGLFYFENTELLQIKTDREIIQRLLGSTVSWLFYVECEDSTIVIQPRIEAPGMFDWDKKKNWKYKKNTDSDEYVAYSEFILYINKFKHPITFEKR